MHSFSTFTATVKPGNLIVITAPSGAGKTTIARHLLNAVPGLTFSISATTRKQRPEEVDGRDYFFMSQSEFKDRAERGEFIEWEEVYHGSFYGTLKREIEKIWQEGKAALFDVDVKGALALKKKFPENTLTILIKPPTFEILMHRLHSRATEPPEKIEERIRKAQYELQFETSFDVAIVNDDLVKAFRESEAAVRKFLLP
jgi:guanylate kinase